MVLDERQQTVKKVFSKEQLESMSVADIVALVGEVKQSNGKFIGKAVVRSAEGYVKYDNPDLKGQYAELEDES